MRHAIDRRPVIITTDIDFDPLLGLALSNGDDASLWRMFPHCRAAVGAPPGQVSIRSRGWCMSGETKRLKSRCATLTYMGSVGVRALQQHASEVVRRAAAGEVVEITDRGRPVARLVPTARTTLEGLVTAGLARPARSRLDEQPPPLPARRGAPSLSDLLAEARRAER